MPFPLDFALVKRTETRLGRSLPLGYLAKMCRDNGGEVLADHDSWNLVPILDDSDQKRLKRTCNDLVRETAAAQRWPGFPSDAVVIADNGTGDKLLFLPDRASNRFADVVYRWDHETGQVHKVADSFDEL